MDGWHHNQKMHHLCSTREDMKRHHQQHMLEKFDKLSQKNSNSIRDLVTLAAQIPHPHQDEGEEEVDGILNRGYWSNPEDQVWMYMCMCVDK